MQTADDISLFRDFVQGDLFDQEAGDAMLGAIADCMDYSWEDPRFQKVRTTWGADNIWQTISHLSSGDRLPS